MHRAIVASQPIEQWHFETLRAGYQALLKQVGDRVDLEDTLRARLGRVTEHERAARAARTIEEILARSHRRDSEVAAVRRDLAQLERTRARAYDAVGFIQPSARTVDGHRVFALIGRKGSTIAYLDIPPGLDPAPLLAQRVGVRGQSHFKEDLGTRLITVRDLENFNQQGFSMPILDYLFGRPLATYEEGEQRVGVLAGISMLGLDALGSAAYGPEAALTLLIPLGASGLGHIGPISTLIIIILLVVYFSYRQTITAYPHGGGSYTVAKENLGTVFGLLAAASLMLDYVLVVAVGISAGVGALVSALPVLQPYTTLYIRWYFAWQSWHC
jgi:hypothetical protein